MKLNISQQLLMNQFGGMVEPFFGEIVLACGSVMTTKDWRDVDVVVILPWGKWKYYDFGEGMNRTDRYRSIVTAYSALGQNVTGLPIDFHICPFDQWIDHYSSLKHERLHSLPFKTVGLLDMKEKVR